MIEANRKRCRMMRANILVRLSFKSWLPCVREKPGCWKEGRMSVKNCYATTGNERSLIWEAPLPPSEDASSLLNIKLQVK